MCIVRVLIVLLLIIACINYVVCSMSSDDEGTVVKYSTPVNHASIDLNELPPNFATLVDPVVRSPIRERESSFISPTYERGFDSFNEFVADTTVNFKMPFEHEEGGASNIKKEGRTSFFSTDRDDRPEGLDRSVCALANSFALSHINLEKFDGSDSVSAYAWLKRYEKFTTLNNYSEEGKKEAFSLWLEGKAFKWFEAKDFETDSWDEVKSAFLARYKQNSVKIYDRLDKLYLRKQKDCENFEDFLQDLEHEARSLERLDDNFVKDAVIRNSRPQVKQFILTRPHDTKDQVLESARMADAAFGSAAPSTDKLVSVIEDLKGQISTLTAAENARDNRLISYGQRGVSPNRVTFQTDSGGRAGFQRQGRGGTQTFYRPQGQRQLVSYQRSNSMDRTGRYGQEERFNPRNGQQMSQQRKPCRSCGRTHFSMSECFARSLQCFKCGRVGHLSRFCFSQPNTYRGNMGIAK